MATQQVEGMSPVRVQALQDGVFAIVMTLMILEFHIPVVQTEGQLWDTILSYFPLLAAYVVTFANLGVYWIAQHTQFHYIEKTDRIILWINILFLMLISLIPFSTELVGTYHELQLPYVIYGVHLICIAAVIYMQWCYASKHHRLTRHDVRASTDKAIRRRALLGMGLCCIAIAGSFINMHFSLLLYLLMPPYYMLAGKHDPHWKQAAVEHED